MPPSVSLVYRTCADFRALIDTWVHEMRCPVPLVDLCLELDMGDAAEAARWASSTPQRPFYGDRRRRFFPYPYRTYDVVVGWGWSVRGRYATDYDCSDALPFITETPLLVRPCCVRSNALESILAMLRSWPRFGRYDTTSRRTRCWGARPVYRFAAPAPQLVQLRKDVG